MKTVSVVIRETDPEGDGLTVIQEEVEQINRLTPAESERLALLAEQMGEAIQAICRVLRHGYESYNLLDPKRTSNRELLTSKTGHVLYAMSRLVEAGDMDSGDIEAAEHALGEWIDRSLHHQ